LIYHGPCSSSNRVQKLIRDTPLWRERDELLRSAPGVGEVLSGTLLAQLPEVGMLKRRKIAVLRPPQDQRPGDGSRTVQPRQWQDVLDARDLERSRQGARDALHVHAGSNPTQPGAAGLLSSSAWRRQETKGGVTARMRMLLIMLNTVIRHQTTWDSELGGVQSDLPYPFFAARGRCGHYFGQRPYGLISETVAIPPAAILSRDRDYNLSAERRYTRTRPADRSASVVAYYEGLRSD
jgi:hypothetical protein